MPRDFKHNYRSRCIYHITMTKAPGTPVFSNISGTPKQPFVERTPLGKIIESQILNFKELCPSLRILQYVIMPDHIHFAIFAEHEIPRSLGSYIGMMKVKCGQLAAEHLLTQQPIFEKDFYDRILRKSHKLDIICNYIRQNPHRLLARRANPDFFRRINNIKIGGTNWQAYGNIQLLENPFKGPVIIHRSDSESLKAAKLRRWTHIAENGGVLVSPFISPAEKEIRRKCEELNGKIILLTNRPLGDKEKPGAHDFDLCTQGRLLIIAPMTALPPGRDTFLLLNATAENIALPLQN